MLSTVFWMLLRRRVLRPSNNLGYVIDLLARRDFRGVEVAHIDPIIAPLFDKYNRMVKRMQDLAAAHVKREAALCRDLERSARAMLQQQAVLARSDRWAIWRRAWPIGCAIHYRAYW